MVLINSNTIETLIFKFLPRFDVIRVGSDGGIGFEMLPNKSRHFSVNAKLVDIFSISCPVEHKNLHNLSPEKT